MAAGHSGSAASRRAKDAAMAAYMKKHKIERKVMRDPISHKLVAIGSNPMQWGKK